MSKPANEALQTLLDAMHTEIAAEFLRRIRSGEAAPADLSAAIRFLKDNNITASLAKNTPMQSLAELVPFPAEEDRDFHH